METTQTYDEGEALPIREVAKRVHCSVPTIYREIADGNLKAKKLRRGTRITLRELNRYLDALPDMEGAA